MEQRIFVRDGIELRDDGDTPTITGYAAVFDSEAHGEVIRSGAFKKTIKENKNIRALWNHDTGRPLATTENGTLTLKEDESGLRFEMQPNSDTSWGKDAIASIKRGDVKGMSFGFEVIKEEFTKRDNADDVLRELIEVRLFEVSPVTFPWYEDTEVDVRALVEKCIDERLQSGAQELQRATAPDSNSAKDDETTPEPEPALHSEAGTSTNWRNAHARLI